MRICRYLIENEEQLGFYFDDYVVPLEEAVGAFRETFDDIALESAASILDVMPGGTMASPAHRLAEWVSANNDLHADLGIPAAELTLLAPLAAPPKILLLAGNYAAHIEEEGKIALERAETFPYVFMKPATTVNHPNAPIAVPRVSPDSIDYECELGVIIGKRARAVSEEAALEYVAGYTVINDISDRRYKPFPERKPRERDAFFDWLHGKWHDGFFPMGPCMTTARAIPNPQILGLTMHVNGELRQNASTAHMIFPVAAVIEFISRTITLEPGDIIATGTPAGIGMTTGRFLKPGDTLDSTIEGIGTLHNTMAAEA
ncbi:MAG: fumarylacetoacetate hydrolase family protein [Candidatus Hydrogenedentes bacterium]|nr:fumarylacetoacetate hydrolase family protein [Candidatus Hydrogenedentota bacterium]